MTNYDLATEMESHLCTSDLAQLKQSVHDPDVWLCDCGSTVEVPLWDVVEMLRERAVAQDAATRLHGLRSADPIEFQQIQVTPLREEFKELYAGRPAPVCNEHGVPLHAIAEVRNLVGIGLSPAHEKALSVERARDTGAV